jgi:hypothetical protein
VGAGEAKSNDLRVSMSFGLRSIRFGGIFAPLAEITGWPSKMVRPTLWWWKQIILETIFLQNKIRHKIKQFVSFSFFTSFK